MFPNWPQYCGGTILSGSEWLQSDVGKMSSRCQCHQNLSRKASERMRSSAMLAIALCGAWPRPSNHDQSHPQTIQKTYVLETASQAQHCCSQLLQTTHARKSALRGAPCNTHDCSMIWTGQAVLTSQEPLHAELLLIIPLPFIPQHRLGRRPYVEWEPGPCISRTRKIYLQGSHSVNVITNCMRIAKASAAWQELDVLQTVAANC